MTGIYQCGNVHSQVMATGSRVIQNKGLYPNSLPPLFFPKRLEEAER